MAYGAILGQRFQPYIPEPPASTELSQLSEGTLIKIVENSSPVEFYVAKHNYESSENGLGSTLVVRKDIYNNQAWNTEGNNAYGDSSINDWFNFTYLNFLSDYVRSVVGFTKIPYTPGGGNLELRYLSTSVFALSATELGESQSWFNVEGSILPIASTLKNVNMSGTLATQWTRSPHKTYNTAAVYINNIGKVNFSTCTNSNGSRPCFTLPSTALVDSDNNLIEQ